MAHLNRLISEQASQILMLASSFADRLLFTSIAYRIWGPAVFEQWAFWFATAGLVSFFEFGFSFYFANQIAMETERKEIARATRYYAIANFVSLVSALLGIGYVAATLFALRSPASAALASAGWEWPLTLAFLAGALAVRMAANGAYALYRANRQYARQSTISALAEFVRVAAVVAAALLGGGPAVVAGVTFAVALTIQVAFVWRDALRRFEPHRFVIAAPNWRETREALTISAGFFSQLLPLMLLTNAPVILLTYEAPATGVIAAVVMARTLINLPRALLQSFGVVMGLECGRRIAGGDQSGARAVWQHSARIIAAVSGLISGVAIAGGRELFHLWTNDPALYHFEYLLMAALPMAIGTTSIINHNVLFASNATLLPALGRMLQLALSVALFYALPLADAGLRMLAALAIGEIVGFMPLAALAIQRLLPTIRFRDGLEALAVSTTSLLASALATYGLTTFLRPSAPLPIVVTLALAGLCCAAMLPWFGFNAHARGSLWRRAAEYGTRAAAAIPAAMGPFHRRKL